MKTRMVNILFEGIGVPSWTANILEGMAKLLGMAMFLSAAYAALLEQITASVEMFQNERIKLARLTPRPFKRYKPEEETQETGTRPEPEPGQG